MKGGWLGEVFGVKSGNRLVEQILGASDGRDVVQLLVAQGVVAVLAGLGARVDLQGSLLVSACQKIPSGR